MANILDKIYEKAKLAPQRVAFPEGENEKIMQDIELIAGELQKLEEEGGNDHA